MNDSFLRRILGELKVPASTAAAREGARHRALIAFQNRDEWPNRTPFFSTWRSAFAVITAVAACIIAALFFFRPPNQTENLANDRQLLRQIEQLFPNQLNAVVQKDGQTVLSVGEDDSAGADQPVLLLFERHHELVRVLSFSGHRVCVPLGKHDACFDVLESAEGGVILAGEQDVLVPSRHPIFDGYSVRAERISL